MTTRQLTTNLALAALTWAIILTPFFLLLAQCGATR